MGDDGALRRSIVHRVEATRPVTDARMGTEGKEGIDERSKATCKVLCWTVGWIYVTYFWKEE